MDRLGWKHALVGALLTIGALAVLLLSTANAGPINKGWNDVAIKGYDTVAYHTEGRAVKGKSKYSHKWNDAKWYFATPGNRDLFAADPERYAPQYGGY